MISSQLTSILQTYRGSGGKIFIGDGTPDSAVVPVDGGLAVTVASIPDAETVMLFAEVGRLPSSDVATESEWVAVGTEDAGDDPAGDDEAAAILVHDRCAGTLAITASAPVIALDTPTFAGWIRQFAEELAETRSAFEEVLAESADEDAPREFIDGFGQTWA